jgi:hypothetical protein
VKTEADRAAPSTLVQGAGLRFRRHSCARHAAILRLSHVTDYSSNRALPCRPTYLAPRGFRIGGTGSRSRCSTERMHEPPQRSRRHTSTTSISRRCAAVITAARSMHCFVPDCTSSCVIAIAIHAGEHLDTSVALPRRKCASASCERWCWPW